MTLVETKTIYFKLVSQLKMPGIKIPEKQLTELRAFVTLLKSQPSMLQLPELQFLKEYIESLGGRIPTAFQENFSAENIPKTDIPKSCPARESHKPSKPSEDEEPEIVESDVELDETGVIGKWLLH